MPTPTLELADIFRQYGPAYRQAHALPLHHHRVMQAIEACRTPLLGGVVEMVRPMPIPRYVVNKSRCPVLIIIDLSAL
jgi:hypothetical protein